MFKKNKINMCIKLKKRLSILDKDSKLRENNINSVTGYSCPKCNKIIIDTGENSLIGKTKTIFTGDLKEWDYEPGLSWVELHKCEECNTVFWLINGA